MATSMDSSATQIITPTSSLTAWPIVTSNLLLFKWLSRGEGNCKCLPIRLKKFLFLRRFVNFLGYGASVKFLLYVSGGIP